MRPNVVFIVLNWNGERFLGTCLRSVFGQVYDNYKVVVVDNGSSDGSADMVRRDFPGADLLALRENSGYAKGSNAGIKYALEKYPSDYVLLLNNDAELRGGGWLAAMVDAAEADPAAGLLGCRLVFPDGSFQQAGSDITPYGFPGLLPSDPRADAVRPYRVAAVIGAVFMIRREVLDKIGLLDEGFSPFYAEDMDYCARVAKAGYSVKVVPGAEAAHYVSRSINALPSYFVRLTEKKGEVRFKLLHLSLRGLMQFAFFEGRNIAAHLLERPDKNRPAALSNMRLRGNWRENAGIFLRAYLYNLKELPEILAKRYRRSGRKRG